MSRRLVRVPGLEADDVIKYNAAGICTCKDILSRNILELMSVCGSYNRSQAAFKSVSRVVAPKSTTAYTLQSEKAQYFLPTTLPALDSALRGGLPSATVTEIIGPPGCGKTQFSMMMCVSCIIQSWKAHGKLHGNEGSGTDDPTAVVYIDTEAAFSAERLLEIARHKYPNEMTSDNDVKCLTANVHLFREGSCRAFMERLESLEALVISRNIKLIVIDSIASLVRKEFGNEGGVIERNRLLVKQATLLKYLAETFSVPVLVTNQITTTGSFANKPDARNTEDGQDADDAYLTAALGNTWSHTVNTRLMVQYEANQLREIMIAKSPVSAQSSFLYTVTSAGIVLRDVQAV